jgi:hypothetical protein
LSSHDTKELWSSIGHSRSSSVVKLVVDLGPPYEDINAMNQIFADVATDPDYGMKQILSHVKQNDDR